MYKLSFTETCHLKAGHLIYHKLALNDYEFMLLSISMSLAGLLRIIVVMGHSHYGPVVMVHMVVVMVHLGKSLWSTWKSRYGPPRKGSGSSPNQVCLGVLLVIPAIF